MSSGHHIKCKECGEDIADYLGDHLIEVHGLTANQYATKHPGAETVSERLLLLWKAEKGSPPRRQAPPPVSDLRVDICGLKFKVNPDVPETACLPLPPAYRFPVHLNKAHPDRDLARDVRHALVSMRPVLDGDLRPGEEVTSIYIHGISGSGKDAFFHAVSNQLRRPGIIRSIKPGVDIQSWFYSRAFDAQGTTWEEGPLLKALRDGYEIRDSSGALVRRVPYIILITDFDRADSAQHEYLRLITDSIQGRVEGPEGTSYPVLPGTIIACTGNTAGSGDTRGRYTSANVIDGSILNRFHDVFEFHWMVWEDEQPIVKEKFPELVQGVQGLFETMGKVTMALREAIHNNALYADFDHRAVCAVLRHIRNILLSNNANDPVPDYIFKTGVRTWLDRLPDPETREAAKKIMDPHVKGGLLDRGGSDRNAGRSALGDKW